MSCQVLGALKNTATTTVIELKAVFHSGRRSVRKPIKTADRKLRSSPLSRIWDNSEAQFKTLKYLPDFPKAFASLAQAREFCAGFFHEYNYIHRHSGIAWHC